jgi:hypothetical protein
MEWRGDHRPQIRTEGELVGSERGEPARIGFEWKRVYRPYLVSIWRKAAGKVKRFSQVKEHIRKF